MSRGFTLIELIIVIVVIGILLTVTAFTQNNVLASSRDGERADDAAGIARLLEDSYLNQATGSPSYPSIDSFVSDVTKHAGVAANTDEGLFKAPNAAGVSVTGATTADAATPLGDRSVATDQYVYQPLTDAGGLCKTTADTCVRFRIFYRDEDGGQTGVIKSAHQQ